MYFEVSKEIFSVQPAGQLPEQGVKAFSGIQPSNLGLADKMLQYIAWGNCGLILESRALFKSNVPTSTDPTYRPIVTQQLIKFAKATQNPIPASLQFPGYNFKPRPYIILDWLEPIGLSDNNVPDYASAALETAKYANQVADAMKAEVRKTNPSFQVQNNLCIQDVYKTGTDRGTFDFSAPSFVENVDLKTNAATNGLGGFGYVMNDNSHLKKAINSKMLAPDNTAYSV